MNKSINIGASQVYENIHRQIESRSKAIPKTNDMVHEALMTLYNKKGVTLKQIYKYILDTYNLELITNNRTIRIKKHLKSLFESADVVNITGRGLVGHFKLVDKKGFLQKISNNEMVIKAKVAESLKKKQPHSLAHVQQIAVRQDVPVPSTLITSSMFDTPIVPTKAHTSTPFISSLITRAPEARKQVHKNQKKKISQDEIGTPRSSLPKKKRKLH